MQQPQDNADGRYLEACAVRATEGRMTTTTTVMTTCLEPREVSLGKEGVFEVWHCAVEGGWKACEDTTGVRGRGRVELEDRAKIGTPTTDDGDDDNA